MRKMEIKEKKYILDDFFRVEEAYLCFERFDGKMSPVVRRLNFDRGDSVAIIIFNPKTSRILLVNQFKYPAYEKGTGWITETVAGIVEKNESPEAAGAPGSGRGDRLQGVPVRAYFHVLCFTGGLFGAHHPILCRSRRC